MRVEVRMTTTISILKLVNSLLGLSFVVMMWVVRLYQLVLFGVLFIKMALNFFFVMLVI